MNLSPTFISIILSTTLASNIVFASDYEGIFPIMQTSQVPKILSTLVEANRSAYPHALAFNPDATIIAAHSTNQNIDIWDWKHEHKITSLALPDKANDLQTVRPLQFSPDGSLFVACHSATDKGEVVTIWETATWTIKERIVDVGHGSGSTACAFTPDGKYFVRALTRLQIQPGDTLIVYDTKRWQPIIGKRTNPFWVRALSVSPNGKYLAVLGSTVSTSAEEAAINDPDYRNLGPLNSSNLLVTPLTTLGVKQNYPIATRPNIFSNIEWSDDDTVIFSIGQEAGAINIENGKEVFRVASKLAGSRSSLGIADNGIRLLIAHDGPDSAIEVWDKNHSAVSIRIPVDNGGVAAISRDGKYIAAAIKGAVRVWQAK